MMKHYPGKIYGTQRAASHCLDKQALSGFCRAERQNKSIWSPANWPLFGSPILLQDAEQQKVVPKWLGSQTDCCMLFISEKNPWYLAWHMTGSWVFYLMKICEYLTQSTENQVLGGNIENKQVTLAQLFKNDFEIKTGSQYSPYVKPPQSAVNMPWSFSFWESTKKGQGFRWDEWIWFTLGGTQKTVLNFK